MRLIDAEPLVKLLHSRCAQLSDDYGSLAGAVSGCLRLLQSQPTISALINEPLTQEELREMDGEPVWIVPMRGSGGFCTWMLVDAEYELCREVHGEMAVFENCGKTWLAYRCRLEEGNK
ncbi:MAG: hypothetical protein HFF72_03805 [Oscillospiraceae bacterium]|jgi:hypothetical protein|nr:hypothetical protein [Oscillospiraceae bacterium]